MTETIADQIIAQAVCRLQLMQVPLGYQLTTVGVSRPTRFKTQSPGHLRCYVTIDSLEPNEGLSYMGNPPVQGFDLVIRCAMIVTPEESSDISADTWRLRAYGTMGQAITEPADWHNWNGLAVNSQLLAFEMRGNAAEGQVGAHLLVNVQFRTDETNPYNVRR